MAARKFTMRRVAPIWAPLDSTALGTPSWELGSALSTEGSWPTGKERGFYECLDSLVFETMGSGFKVGLGLICCAMLFKLLCLSVFLFHQLLLRVGKIIVSTT